MDTPFKGNRLALAAAGIGLVLIGSKLMLRKKMDLQGQVVLITGSSRGLGLAMAQEFARQGARLVICARDEQELERARRELTRQGAEVLAISCDISDQEQVQRLIDQATVHYGRIDVLVNSAGIILIGPLQTQTQKDFEECMDVMFWGAYYPTIAVLPQMLKRKSSEYGDSREPFDEYLHPSMKIWNLSRYCSPKGFCHPSNPLSL